MFFCPEETGNLKEDSRRLRKSGNKGFRRFLPLLLLAVVLILATAFVLLLPVIKAWFPAKGTGNFDNEPTYQTIALRDPDTLETITVSHLNGETYTLEYQDGILSLRMETGELEAIGGSIADNFIKYATMVYIEDTISQDEGEVLEHMSDMGLEPPQIAVAATFSDGSQINLSLGCAMPGTSYHYYQWSGDNSVYLCNPGVYETFEYTADMLFPVTQPSVNPSLIERISILRGDGEPIVCTFETDSEDMVQGALQSPFAYPMSAGAAHSLLSAVENFRLGVRLKPVTDENRALYGMDTPQAVVKIAQREGLYAQVTTDGALQSFLLSPSGITLTIGNADGEFFRYCEYEGICYRVSGFLVSAFLNADAMAYASLNPADMDVETVKSIVVQTGSGMLNIHASYLEHVLPNNELETDEYGNIIYSTEVTANGDPVTGEAFEALVARLKQMTVSGRLDMIMEPDGAPRWQMKLTTTQGKTRALAAYPMDAFHDMLAVNGTALFYISNEALDIALGEFAALPEPTELP